MRAVILYESLFGNTAAIAQSVAHGLREARPDAVVDCHSVNDTGALPDDVDLVVVGAPTHFWGLTRSISRNMELQYERRIMPLDDPVSATRRAAATTGLRSRLAALPPGRGRAAAAFDTRMTGPLTGGARRAIARRLERAGYRLIAQPQTFLVEAVAGPLLDGETDRARAWGVTLTRALDRHDTPKRRHSMKRHSQQLLTADGTDSLPDRVELDGVPVQAPVHAYRALDVTRVVTTAEFVVGAVLVARYLSRRPGSAKALVTMGPGGWVSMKGGTVAVRRGSRPWARPKPIQPAKTNQRAPLWARVLSAVPLQSLLA